MGVGVGDEEVGGGRPGCAWVDGGGVREVGAMLEGTPHDRSAAPTHHPASKDGSQTKVRSEPAQAPRAASGVATHQPSRALRRPR